MWRDVDTACAATIQITEKVPPDPAAAWRHPFHYSQYRRLYPALKDIFAESAKAVG